MRCKRERRARERIIRVCVRERRRRGVWRGREYKHTHRGRGEKGPRDELGQGGVLIHNDEFEEFFRRVVRRESFDRVCPPCGADTCSSFPLP